MSWSKNCLKCNLQPESVGANRFFQLLRDSYTKLYEQAAPNNWIICVPHSKSIKSLSLNGEIFKSHILHSSPYFKEEFVTLNGQCVTVKDGVINTKTGFAHSCKAYILSEELFYNQDFKSFTVYSISAPLTQPSNSNNLSNNNNKNSNSNYNNNQNSNNKQFNSPRNKSGSDSGNGNQLNNNNKNELASMNKNSNNSIDGDIDSILQMNVENRSVADYHRLIKLWLENSDSGSSSSNGNSNNASLYSGMMNEVNKFANQFNKSYVMIKGYTHSAANRIENFRKNLFSEQLSRNGNDINDSSSKSSKWKSKSKSKQRRKSKMRNLSKFDEWKNDDKHFHLQLAFDCILNETLYQRIFIESLNNHYKKDDLVFYEKLVNLQHLSQEEIGIKKEFECDLSVAIEELSYLDRFQTPIDKISCIKKSVTLIREAIDIMQENRQHLKQSSGKNKKDTGTCFFVFIF